MKDLKHYDRRRNSVAWKDSKETAFTVGLILGMFTTLLSIAFWWGLAG